VRYAVIQASSRKYSSDRFVIAYQDEKCLRDLIAAPSILGVGFESREEAMAKVEGQVSDTAASKEQPRVSTMFDGTRQNRDVAGGHDFVEHRRILRSILQSALGAVVILLYSKNPVSVMIRTALGASF
jgi:hypothetical protein